MKDCGYWQQQISRLLDDDLTEAEQAALWEHIGGCPDCAQAFEDFSQQTSVLRAQVVRPPVDLSKLVMARIKTGQTDPARFQRPETKKPVSHRLRPRRKLAIAACFVGLVAAAAVTGIFSQNVRLSGGADTAAYLPEAQSDTLFVQLPENTLSPTARSGQAPEQAPQAAEQPAVTAAENGTQAPPPEAEDTAPAPDALSLPEAIPDDSAAADSASISAPPAVDTDADAASGMSAPAEQADLPPAAADSGVMTIMQPAPEEQPEAAAEPAYIFTGGVVAGRIEDADALAALLTGESWQGQDPAVLYTLSFNGAAYAIGQDENGALLWQRDGEAGFTLSPASLAELEALIVKE